MKESIDFALLKTIGSLLEALNNKFFPEGNVKLFYTGAWWVATLEKGFKQFDTPTDALEYFLSLKV